MHEIHVSVVSAEEASYGVAEFWSGGRMIGFAHVDDGDLMLRIEPRDDGAAVVIGARGSADALAEANRAPRVLLSPGNDHRTDHKYRERLTT
jgi:hypothetical protein